MQANQDKAVNSIFEGIQRVGQSVEEAIHVWGQGLGVHNHNLLESLETKVEDPALGRAVLGDLWSFFHQQGLEKPNRTLGVEDPPDLEAINQTLEAIMNDGEHPALLGMGDDAGDALVNWVQAFTIYDFAAYTFLEKHLGAKEGLAIYMGLWESFALGVLPQMKQALGIQGPQDVDMAMIRRLSEAYWAAIGIASTTTQFDDQVYEAELSDCAYWLNMKHLLGEDKARSMTLKTEAVVSVNYYDAILKALGVFDRYRFTMDKFQCCGDEHCRVRFNRRS